MKTVTYREFLEYLKNSSDEVLDQDMTVYHAGEEEFHPVKNYLTSGAEWSTDVLDDGHLYLVVGLK
jgi:hypothetical protein